MKRKTFRMSGGKDRKAQKEKFVFSMSPEEEALPDMETKEDIVPVETPQNAPEISSEENIQAEAITTVQDDIGISSEKEYSEKKEEPLQTMEITDIQKPQETQTEAPLKSKDDSDKAVKTECVPDIPLPKFYNGPNLAEIRKRCGITLRAIWEETKIPVKTLEDIEIENYEALPPEVYARSFVSTYAKILSLDPKKAVKDYMERYSAWKADTAKQQKKKASGSIFGIKMKQSK
ncbi:MAG: hypothetical protein BWK80_59965 [Desulfobacteraceae bacterium IS3]|nr:MAG: hypothetical protein BWK80_59965 [Desulfobacteraceae bacterium IS3]HAO23389.1 hypothetical protein [Desulfobacteraceae bacterium]